MKLDVRLFGRALLSIERDHSPASTCEHDRDDERPRFGFQAPPCRCHQRTRR